MARAIDLVGAVEAGAVELLGMLHVVLAYREDITTRYDRQDLGGSGRQRRTSGSDLVFRPGFDHLVKITHGRPGPEAERLNCAVLLVQMSNLLRARLRVHEGNIVGELCHLVCSRQLPWRWLGVSNKLTRDAWCCENYRGLAYNSAHQRKCQQEYT